MNLNEILDNLQEGDETKITEQLETEDLTSEQVQEFNEAKKEAINTFNTFEKLYESLEKQTEGWSEYKMECFYAILAGLSGQEQEMDFIEK